MKQYLNKGPVSPTPTGFQIRFYIIDRTHAIMLGFDI